MNALKVVVSLILAGGVIGSFVISARMARLDAGLEQNLAATKRLIDLQKAVRSKNEVLMEMVTVTERLDAGLRGLAERTDAIQGQVLAVSAANRETLVLNQALAAAASDTNGHLRAMVQTLASLNETTGYIHNYIQDLHAVLQGDVGLMRQIAGNTSIMNQKIPEWLLR